MNDTAATKLVKATQRLMDIKQSQRDRAAELAKTVGAQREETPTDGASANTQ
jgi:hypothetical protein